MSVIDEHHLTYGEVVNRGWIGRLTSRATGVGGAQHQFVSVEQIVQQSGTGQMTAQRIGEVGAL